jgi:hypothetical protein
MRVTSGESGIPWKHRGYVRKKYPSVIPFSKEQLKILKKLGETAPTNAHKLSKATRKAYSFVHNTLVEFEHRKIASSRLGKSEKQTPERIYDLELEGIFWILQREIGGWEHDKKSQNLINRMFKHYYHQLPLVFGKWSYFRDLGLANWFFIRLKILVDTHMKNPFYKGTGYYYWLEMEQQMTRFFYLFDFYRLDNHFITDFDLKIWLTALKNDKGIRDYVIQELEYERKMLKKNLTNVEDVLSFMQTLTDHK